MRRHESDRLVYLSAAETSYPVGHHALCSMQTTTEMYPPALLSRYIITTAVSSLSRTAISLLPVATFYTQVAL